MLERVRRKGNPTTLLVGMQTSTAAMENSVEIPLKTGNSGLQSIIQSEVSQKDKDHYSILTHIYGI